MALLALATMVGCQGFSASKSATVQPPSVLRTTEDRCDLPWVRLRELSRQNADLHLTNARRFTFPISDLRQALSVSGVNYWNPPFALAQWGHSPFPGVALVLVRVTTSALADVIC